MIHADEGTSYFPVAAPLGCGGQREPGTGALKVKSRKGTLTALGKPLHFTDEEHKVWRSRDSFHISQLLNGPE